MFPRNSLALEVGDPAERAASPSAESASSQASSTTKAKTNSKSRGRRQVPARGERGRSQSPKKEKVNIIQPARPLSLWPLSAMRGDVQESFVQRHRHETSQRQTKERIAKAADFF